MKNSLHIAVTAAMIMAFSGMGNRAYSQFLHQKKDAPIHVEKYSWTGSLDSVTPISIWFERNDDNLLAGEIVYTASQTKSPVRVLGQVIVNPNTGVEEFRLSEFLGRRAEKTGTMQFVLDSVGKGSGFWKNIDTSHVLVLDKVTAFPDGKGGLLQPENYTTIGTKPVYYSYYYYHPYKGTLGGEATLELMEHKYIKFQITIRDPNIAEGDDELDYHRHAPLVGNKFIYHMRGCDYMFECHIFHEFIFLKTLTDRPSDCFGVGTSFDGFLIKR